MRIQAMLMVLGWYSLTGVAGAWLFRRGRHRALALAGLGSSIIAAVLALLIVFEWVDFFGDSFERTSVWFKFGVVLSALNLALAFTCLLFLSATSRHNLRAVRAGSVLSFWLAMVIVTAAGSNDRFLYTMDTDPLVVGALVAFLTLAILGALVVWRGSRS